MSTLFSVLLFCVFACLLGVVVGILYLFVARMVDVLAIFYRSWW